MDDNQCSESQQENPQEATPHEQREPVMDNEPRASVFNKEPKKPSTPRNAFTAIENVSLVTEAPAEPVLKKMVVSSKFLHRYHLAAMNWPQSK
ncbi:unnamed protein product [Acanthoscelides obtectus]|uniref:Uncharacterized protein n=1 Tax=Acanthoscelides obtectus TaxID=200917 RepID=A0A9P0L3I3_ACAOB|nr:unnamed protein product [Acanthoscelides obtectus]CAK1662229.1 hypothetical protein AOBTE_LOCUS23045 [Acanthoscelides obtectus]